MAVRAKPDGTYTFIQPTGRVAIEVNYQAVQGVGMPWSSPFSDVSQDDRYFRVVRFAQENGLMSGYAESHFSPNNTLTCAQLVQILFNKEDGPAADHQSTHSDVVEDTWCVEAIHWITDKGIAGGYILEALRWVAENGIPNGSGDECHIPEGRATRAHAAQALKNFIKSQAADA